MNNLLCAHCGERTVMSRCTGCRQRAASCTCRPATRQPAWLRRGLLARDETGRVAA